MWMLFKIKQNLASKFVDANQ